MIQYASIARAARSRRLEPLATASVRFSQSGLRGGGVGSRADFQTVRPLGAHQKTVRCPPCPTAQQQTAQHRTAQHRTRSTSDPLNIGPAQHRTRSTSDPLNIGPAQHRTCSASDLLSIGLPNIGPAQHRTCSTSDLLSNRLPNNRLPNIGPPNIGLPNIGLLKDKRPSTLWSTGVYFSLRIREHPFPY
jgi:hypothetical protein